MKRVTIFSTAIAALIAVFPMVSQQQATIGAQDVTITIHKDKDKPDTKPPFTGDRPSVDVAILLDTSNSMDGLINQAKTQLWKIVQQFSDAEKAGKTPLLRVSVFEYGNTRLPASEGYIRQVVQLTDDLDKVSEALFGLKTSGGDEYCGMVINEALSRLDWSSEPNAYKAIFIAGNEPFTQGSVDYQKSCTKAIQSGVVINTIHCGDYQAGIQGKWQHGAMLGEGEYLNIDQDRAVVHIKCPQDKIIIELNNELNKTYLWYGTRESRQAYSANQVAQDKNALEASGGAGLGGRGLTKASGVYSNAGRDLIDTLQQDEAILAKLDVEMLPDELQKMSADERKAHVSKLAAKRDELKKKILAVSKERDAYAAKVRREQAESAEPGEEGSTLGDAVAAAVQKQLKESGFEVKKK
jgi:hypothetical protein